MYKLGTLTEFELDNKAAKKAAGWISEEITNGRIVIDGEVGVPDSIITNLLSRRQNPTGSDQYLWKSESGDIIDTFNILAIWSKSIKNPSSTKYYIARKSVCGINEDGEKDCHLYGEVTSKQVVSFGSQVAEIEIFDGKRAYNARIKELGIKIEKI
tara:strand:+ start:171 stop:638 length:468 start_codon:yes stop_codon:yes gene_type:complete